VFSYLPNLESDESMFHETARTHLGYLGNDNRYTQYCTGTILDLLLVPVAVLLFVVSCMFVSRPFHFLARL